jgi:hypothetical protein
MLSSPFLQLLRAKSAFRFFWFCGILLLTWLSC